MAKPLKWLGAVLTIAALALAVAARAIPERADALLVVVLSVPMLAAGAFLIWRGRQYAYRARAKTVVSDAKADLLYLRDFSTDSSALKNVFAALTTPVLMSGLTTEEEQLAEAMQPLGDLVAIGRPGETLPTPGAARVYASDEEWRDVVSKQMQAARFVVIRAGSGEGLLWELKRAFELVPPQKLLFLVLRMKREHYAHFRQTVRATFGVSLPAPEAFAVSFGKLSGFIAFAADWTPSALPLKAPFLSRVQHKPLRAMCEHALQPVFKAAGVECPPPRMRPVMVFALVFATVFAIVFAGAFAIAVYEMWKDQKPKETFAEASTEEEVEDVYAAATARFQERLLALDGLQQIVASSHPDEARMVGYRLASDGLRRLDDDLLIDRAAVTARILEEADTETCAAIARGDAVPGMESALRRLSAGELDQYFEVIYQATSAELHDVPAPGRPPMLAIEQSFDELFATMSPEDANLLSAVLRNPRAETSEDVCRAGRLLHENLMMLPEQSKTTLARALVWP